MSAGTLRIVADRVDETDVYYRYYSSYNLGGRPRANANLRFGSAPRGDLQHKERSGRLYYVVDTPSDVKGGGRPSSLLLDVTDALIAHPSESDEDSEESVTSGPAEVGERHSESDEDSDETVPSKGHQERQEEKTAEGPAEVVGELDPVVATTKTLLQGESKAAEASPSGATCIQLSTGTAVGTTTSTTTTTITNTTTTTSSSDTTTTTTTITTTTTTITRTARSESASLT